MARFFRMGEPEYGRQVPAWMQRSLEESGLGAVEMPLFVAGDEPSWQVPAAFVFEMPPGYVLFRHAHPCHRVEVVVKGSLDVGEGEPLGPGDVMVAGPGEMYGPHTAGPDGCTTVEIFSAAEGVFRVIEETPAGPQETDVRRGEMPRGMASPG